VRHRPPLAITRIEVLAIVGIVAMLIALILPAVQYAHEVGRRAQCRGYLMQLGTAMHNYHDKHKVFPPGITAAAIGPSHQSPCAFVANASTCDDPTSSHVSGLSLILPFLEEHAVYGAYNLQLACCAKANATSTSRTIRVFVCPSNPRQRNSNPLPYYGAQATPGPTDYVLSMGAIGQFDCDNPFSIRTGGPPTYFPWIMSRGHGAFNVNRSTSIDRIRDGTANTFLMGESVGGAELYLGLANGAIVDGARPMTAASPNVFCENPWSKGYISSQNGGANQGYGSVFGATAWNAWYDTNGNLTDPGFGKNWFPYPLNEGKLKFNRPTWAKNSRLAAIVTATNGTALPGTHGSAQGFRSYHPSVVNFLLGDGSVRSITESIDARILVAYSSIAGREPSADAE